MRTRGLWLVAAVLAAVTGAARAGDQDFTLVNKTGVEIYALYVSASDQEEWGEDVLGADTLPSGEKVIITFSADEDAELWDVKVEDDEGHAIVWRQLNLLKIAKLTLHYDADTEEATATAD